MTMRTSCPPECRCLDIYMLDTAELTNTILSDLNCVPHDRRVKLRGFYQGTRFYHVKRHLSPWNLKNAILIGSLFLYWAWGRPRSQKIPGTSSEPVVNRDTMIHSIHTESSRVGSICIADGRIEGDQRMTATECTVPKVYKFAMDV